MSEYQRKTMKLTEFSRIKRERAKELRKKGAYDEAEEEIKEALEEQPEHLLLKVSLAAIYLKQERHPEARSIAVEVLSQEPSNAQALYLMGEISLKEKRFREALDYLKKADQKDPSPFLKTAISRALTGMGGNREALEILENELIREPENPRILKQKARILNRMGRFSEALNIYEGLKGLFPNDEFLRKEVMRLKGLKEDPSKIIRELEVTLNMPSQKDNAQLWGLLAQKLKEEGRLEEAARSFEKAFELRSDNPYFLKQAGFCYYALKRYENSAAAMGRALRMDPDDYYIKSTLDKIYEKSGDLNAYLELIEDVLEAHPGKGRLMGKARSIRKKLEKRDPNDE